MKKLLFAGALAAMFSACSTATLINFNVDGDSFIPAGSLSTPVPFLTGVSVNQEIPAGGLALPTPNLNFLTAVRLKIKVGVVSSVAGALTGSFQLFVAPNNTANLYDPANKVPTSTNCTTDTTVDGVAPVDLTLNLSSTSPAACAAAFSRIQAGQFKIGARVSGTISADTTLTFTINDFDVGISGYPVKILQ